MENYAFSCQIVKLSTVANAARAMYGTIKIPAANDLARMR
jgi:hypothetical protein